MPVRRNDILQLHPYRIRNGVLEHLVLRRSDTDELCPGAWQVVTGGTQDTEGIDDAARRELLEETGLVARRWYATGQVASFFFAPFDCVVDSPIVVCEIDPDAIVSLSAEHVEYRWCTTAIAREILTFPSHRDALALVEASASHTSAEP